MLIKREEAFKVMEVINRFLSMKFSDIRIQYKLMKLKKAIQADYEIYQEQMMINCNDYFEKDDNGKIIFNEFGGIKIKDDYTIICQDTINKLYEQMIQIEDIYFSLDELESLELTLEELFYFDTFIKN